jgi:hypothetical protein
MLPGWKGQPAVASVLEVDRVHAIASSSGTTARLLPRFRQQRRDMGPGMPPAPLPRMPRQGGRDRQDARAARSYAGGARSTAHGKAYDPLIPRPSQVCSENAALRCVS